ncbi:protein of unknown function DUF497 [Geotalea daltonii FRC-32]|uniref:BrnT family toxin n=1 Tax=Geotalea daltonii (strain DSM 22248 / JCM 15807 / FRC-32) TaxID=316067 RepID=B9M250_GEODF|nr:BrnT family toxin [Geotalea daltonii]ACM21168.1 protein of unknown function DUF497 [Geotalea daltonii FRC-32]
MQLVWDENKNTSNKIKHKVSFELASLVFDDPFHLSVLDRIENGEERWQTLGLVGNVVVLLVAHSFVEQDDDEMIRIISARKATKKERQRYEEGR